MSNDKIIELEEDVTSLIKEEHIEIKEDVTGLINKKVPISPLENGILPLELGVSERPEAIISPTLRPPVAAIKKIPEKTISTIPLDSTEKITEKDDFAFWGYMGRRFTSGSDKLLASIFRSPETIYDVAVNSFILFFE